MSKIRRQSSWGTRRDGVEKGVCARRKITTWIKLNRVRRARRVSFIVARGVGHPTELSSYIQYDTYINCYILS